MRLFSRKEGKTIGLPKRKSIPAGMLFAFYKILTKADKSTQKQTRTKES